MVVIVVNIAVIEVEIVVKGSNIAVMGANSVGYTINVVVEGAEMAVMTGSVGVPCTSGVVTKLALATGRTSVVTGVSTGSAMSAMK